MTSKGCNIEQAILFLYPSNIEVGIPLRETNSVLGIPFIARIFHHLKSIGIKKISIFTSTAYQEISLFLIDENRWGIPIELKALSEKDALHEAKQLTKIYGSLIGIASSLPNLPEPSFSKTEKYMFENNFTGWLALQREDALILEAIYSMEEYLNNLKNRDCLSYEVQSLISCLTPREQQNTVKQLMDEVFPNQLIMGNKAADKVWLGHNVSLPGSVNITPPVFIGENCTIGEGVSLGPYAIVETNSIIGDRCEVKHASIESGTYVGEELNLKNIIVWHHYIAYLDINKPVPISDKFLIGPNIQDHDVPVQYLKQVIFTLLLIPLILLLLISIFIVAILSGSLKILKQKQYLKSPSVADSKVWRTFKCYEFNTHGRKLWQKIIIHSGLIRLPSFYHIFTGKINWIGIKPRNKKHMNQLPKSWQQLLMAGKPGIFTLSELDAKLVKDPFCNEQLYASDAFYITRADFNLKCRMMFQCFYL
ncbi:MAG: sugar transferase [Lentisphaeria bacterium]|nr:sugar transferase [Lentisphaeria bacterium]